MTSLSSIRFNRIRENAKLPSRAYEEDVGADIFYCYDPAFKYKENGFYDKRYALHVDALDSLPRENKKLYIYPQSSIRVPTGLRVDLPKGFSLEIKNKSGVAYKDKLLVGSCIVDPRYHQEIFVNLHNVGDEVKVFEDGQKIAQMVLYKFEAPHIYEITAEEWEQFVEHSERNGGFGSSGNF
jgi:dUTP pyrophosphatase